MRIVPLIWIIPVALVTVCGCRWRDDFRDRRQPQPLEMPMRASINPQSEDYSGNPFAEEAAYQKAVKFPAIDDRAKIPEVPEYPSGTGFSDCDQAF